MWEKRWHLNNEKIENFEEEKKKYCETDASVHTANRIEWNDVNYRL